MVDSITVATVVDSPQPTYSGQRWSKGQFDYMPLFDLPNEGTKSAVHLIDLHSVNSVDLRVSERIAALSDFGITVLLQRWIFQMSRVPVVLPELAELVGPLLAEAEIQEDWCAAALASAGSGGTDAAVLAASSARLQEVLGGPGPGTLRAELKDPAMRATVRKRVAAQRVRELGL